MKIEAIQNYLKNYRDLWGRFCLNKRDKKHDQKPYFFDNFNPHLFDGYIALLLCYAEREEGSFTNGIRENLRRCEVVPGLYAMQPEPIPQASKEEPRGKRISHDEMTGIVLQSIYLNRFRASVESRIPIVENIIKYGKSNWWSFNNYKPHSFELESVRLPRDTGFYKLISDEYSPSLLELLFLGGSFIFTAINSLTPPDDIPMRPDWDDVWHTDKWSKWMFQNMSGELMAWYRYKAIKYANRSNWFLDSCFKIYERIMKGKLGEDYISVVHWVYFKDINHPIHKLILFI